MAERSAPADVAAMDARIAGVGDWRGETLARMRALIREALPDVVETMKWKKPSNPAGVPVWERAGGGILCTGDAFKDKVKFTFGRGAMLSDPDGVFNAGLNGNAMRAIDLRKGETVDPDAFRELVQVAAADQAAQRQKR
ncbi:DUF1801 domain-containing protein [Sphingomonas sp. SUN019]|uniref:DUF1801 domain-containing protein n=1 Tax=Sphingomonas sp. SUN019 TaxID=2937788 RepID=UPI002164027F|nr:DUF1801 domain-containing protein [Sphingomonas sp. SUN019]UVO51299.1 DUF1801 domain-containing protein [Sphingomonas sp. SUN019]